MIFETSGSTGQPKRIEHISALLRREAAFFLELLGRPVRVVRYVPKHHLYGYIFTVLLPELAGVPVEDARTFEEGYRAVKLHPGDLLIATPHQWQFLVDRGTVFPAGITGVTSAAACPVALFQTLRAQMRVLEVYGSTETSGVGYRFDPEEPYHLLPWLEAGDPGLEQNDHLRWTGPGTFFVEGRKDGAVEISGIKVYPGEVERRLRQLPGVQDCAVRAMTPEEGRRLKACVVCGREEQPAVLREIERTFRGPERLASVVFVAGVPRSPEGKPVDWAAFPCTGEANARQERPGERFWHGRIDR